MDQYIKTAGSQISERNEQVAKLNQRLAFLENFYEENQTIIAGAKKMHEESMAKVREQLQFELDEAKLTKAENVKMREKIQKLQD